MAAIRFGSVEVLAVNDGRFARPPGRFFPETPAEAWAPYRRYLDEHGDVPLNLGSFVLRADGRTVLVDTGLGPRLDLGNTGERLPDALRSAGVALDAIDFVLITHMHMDHIGWNTVDGEQGPAVTFPRARYLVQETEWHHWMQPVTAQTPHLDDEDETLLNAVARPLERDGVLDLVSGEHAVTPSVRFLPAPGHTPGHACILIDSGGERAVILGDAAHSPAQIPEPDWPVGADQDRLGGIATRRRLWDQIEQQGLTVCAGHFSPPNTGRFVRVEGRRMWAAGV